MKTYYLGTQLLQYPWIQWSKAAEFETTEDFETSELAANKLVKERDDIVQVYGTYSYHIVDGAFVDRTEEEMHEFETAFNAKNLISLNRKRIETLRETTFTYADKEFPMDENSRVYYSTFNKIATSKKVLTANGEFYALDKEKIDEFLTVYYQKLNDITQHDD